MAHLSNKLRIGEKIGLSFGLVALLLLAVIWQYHFTLSTALTRYQQLQQTYQAKQGRARDIERSLLEARRAEKDFLIHRDPAYVEEVERDVGRALDSAAGLGEIDPEAAQTAARIQSLIETYRKRFLAIAEAWRIRGLDHNSGLQGSFRDTVHTLEDLAGHFKVDRLYLQLLQIRRAEKDLGLRRDPLYRDKSRRLIAEFHTLVTASRLKTSVKAALQREIDTYLETFETYAKTALDQQDIKGGKGPFRETAHRIEDILRAHFVPDMEANILQLRRREKDYLLRLDKRYVDMALAEHQKILDQVQAAEIADDDKARLTELLADYRRDFLALVAQNDRIDELSEEMKKAADQVFPLVAATVREAEQRTAQATRLLNESARSDERIMLWAVLVASLLGIFFAVIITLRITRPVIRMAGLLDRLAYEDPAERMPSVPGGRDEINAMAESVNQIADHKARLVSWWKTSMQELEAARDLQLTRQGAGEKEAISDAEQAFVVAAAEKNALRASILTSMVDQAQHLVRLCPAPGEPPPPESASERARQAREAAQSLLAALAVLREDATPVTEPQTD
jgi:HAMP domain-containing protein